MLLKGLNTAKKAIVKSFLIETFSVPRNLFNLTQFIEELT